MIDLIYKPICDDCGGTDFEIVCTDPLPESKYISASECFYPNPIVEGIPAVMIYSHYKATCRKCHKEYKYTR